MKMEKALVVLCGVLTASSLFADLPQGLSDGLVAEAGSNVVRKATLTAAVWARPDLRPLNVAETSEVLSCGDAGWNSGFMINLYVREDRVYAMGCRMGGRRPDGRFTRTVLKAPGVEIPSGRWSHLAITWNGSDVVLYVNGKEVSRGKHDFGFEAPVGKGQTPVVAEDVVTATEARLWDRVLSPAEIEVLCRASRPTLSTTENVVSLLERSARGQSVSARMILSAIGEKTLAKGTRPAVLAALAFGWIADGDLAAAAKARLDYLKLVRARGLADPCLANDFELRFSDALVQAGHAPDAIPGLPARAELTKELPVAFIATPQPGATVSRTMPKTAFYVAPDGDDKADGSKTHPFATLVRARDAVRSLRKNGLPEDGVAVKLRGGTYAVDRTLELAAEDSGTPTAPVVWCAEEGERAVLSGYWDVPALERPAAEDPVLARIPATARSQVQVSDVKGFPHWKEKLPAYRAGYRRPLQPITELYCGNARLTPAQTPNAGTGWCKITGFACETVMDGAYEHGRRFFKGDLPTEELAAWQREPDAMITGYFQAFWLDETFEVRGIDPVKGVIDIGDHIYLGTGLFFLHNGATALDSPGEWYLDRASGRLYVIPPENGGIFRFSSCSNVFVSAKGVSNLRIEGLVFEGGRMDAVEMPGCTNVVFAGNVVRNFSGRALVSESCANLSIEGNVMRTFGCGALKVSGGNRKTLVPAAIRISDNDISDVELRRRTYCPMLQLSGCGVEISCNEFHQAPSSAMRLEGNDFFVVSNFVHDVVLESDDQGAVDIYFNPSYAGNLFGWNVWKNCGRHPKGFPEHLGRGAVRFDDYVSLQTVWGNRFIHCGTSRFGTVNVNGGRLNTVAHNVFSGCNRSFGCMTRPFNVWTNLVRKQVAKIAFDATTPTGVDITKPPYATRYPGIATLFERQDGNLVANNILADGTPSGLQIPKETVWRGNRRVEGAEEPAELRGEGICRVPFENEVGPRPTAYVLRAREIFVR